MGNMAMPRVSPGMTLWNLGSLFAPRLFLDAAKIIIIVGKTAFLPVICNQIIAPLESNRPCKTTSSQLYVIYELKISK